MVTWLLYNDKMVLAKGRENTRVSNFRVSASPISKSGLVNFAESYHYPGGNGSQLGILERLDYNKSR